MLCLIEFYNYAAQIRDQKNIQRNYVLGACHLSLHYKKLIWSQSSQDQGKGVLALI